MTKEERAKLTANMASAINTMAESGHRVEVSFDGCGNPSMGELEGCYYAAKKKTGVPCRRQFSWHTGVFIRPPETDEERSSKETGRLRRIEREEEKEHARALRHLELAKRDERVRARYVAGDSIFDLAKEFGLSLVSIRNILSCYLTPARTIYREMTELGECLAEIEAALERMRLCEPHSESKTIPEYVVE